MTGIKILSLTQFLLGPAGVQYLADMGADVIKVEPPRGAWERTWSGANHFLNGVSPFFLLAHRNARSITLDLKRPEAQAVARRLATRADVVVQNFRPGVVARFGLDYESLRGENPGLVYASVSGYGEESPDRTLPGQDLLIQAMAGNHGQHRPRRRTAISGGGGNRRSTWCGAAGDGHSGRPGAARADRRRAENRGHDGAGRAGSLPRTGDLPPKWCSTGPTRPHHRRYVPRRTLRRLQHGRRLHGPLDDADQHPLQALGGVPELTPFEDPDLAMPQREAIAEVLRPILRTRTTGEWLATLREQGVWCAPVNGYDEVFAEPAVQFLDPILEFDHPEAGHVRLVKHPIRYGSGEPELRYLPPAIGEHTEDVLREVGYSPDEIEGLRAAGAI